MKRSKILIVLTVLVALIAGACGDDEDATSSGSGDGGSEETSDLKVALLLPGKINDRGWNAIGHRGLEKIESELNAEIAYTEDVLPADQEEAFRDYASQGFDLVLAMGGQYTDGALAVADEFPDVKFGVIGSNASNESNMASFNARQEQVFFLSGVTAGLATKSNKVAYVSGVEVDNVLRGAAGFKQGVAAVNPDAEVREVWTGDFEDVAKAKEAAQALITEGYDVIQANSNAATFGALEAAQEQGVFGIGAYGDYTFVAPEAVIANSLPALDEVVFRAGQLVADDAFEGTFYLFGYDDFDIGGVTINPDVLGDAAGEIQDTLDDYREQLESGELEVDGPDES